MRKPKKFYDQQTKRRAVDEYISGRKSAQEIADGLGVERGVIYKWRVQLTGAAKGERIDVLEDQGLSRTRETAKRSPAD